MNDPLMTFSRP